MDRRQNRVDTRWARDGEHTMTKEYPDRWFDLKPGAGSGAGRQRLPPAAKLNADGQLVLNHAASELLGNPDRVLVSVNPSQQAIRLRPTTPSDTGGFALSGGGNAQCRVSLREAAKKWPHMLGDYQARKVASGVQLIREED